MSFEDRFFEMLSDDDFDIYERDSIYSNLDELRTINTLYANLVMTAYDAGLLEDIFDEIDINQSFYDEHVKRMTDEFGLTADCANWIVETCCLIYGEKVLHIDCDFKTKGKKESADINQSKNNSKSTKPFITSGKSIYLSNIKEGGKIPKDMIIRVYEAERKYNIEELSLTVTNDGDLSFQDSLKVVGEITGTELKEDVVIFIMVYNAQNELIGTSFRERIDKEDFDGFTTFSSKVYLPKGESISRIVVRPVQNPAGIW